MTSNNEEHLYSFDDFDANHTLDDEDRLDGDDNLFESLLIDENLNEFLNNTKKIDETHEQKYEETDDHLPRVQEELDKLNYSNESINNLELELEESKREYAALSEQTQAALLLLEKKLGSCVAKTSVYFDGLIELHEAKEIYIKAKHQFEAAQALYVASKEMQAYAEDNLELNLNKDLNRQTLKELLENSIEKALEAEKAKQIRDKKQIDASLVYEERQTFIREFEKKHKRMISKAKEYYELRAKLNKELKFQHSKIEGLKNCIKEAKSFYKQSLCNLEKISSDIHSQRKALVSSSSINDYALLNDKNQSQDDLSSVNTEYVSFNFDHQIHMHDSLSIPSNTPQTTEELKACIESHDKNNAKNDNQHNQRQSQENTCKKEQQQQLRPQFRAHTLVLNKINN